MACLITPGAAALIAVGVRRKIPAYYHPEWLIAMLGGGFIVLAIDHIAAGEIVPYFPFLTALQNTADVSLLLQEIALIGGTMTATIFFVWVLLIIAHNNSDKIRRLFRKVTNQSI